MNENKTNSIIGLTIALILTAILLPIAINQFYESEIQITEITSLDSTDRTSMLLNGTGEGLWNGSILESSFTNYTDIIYNTTLTNDANFTITFTITCNNSSKIEVIGCETILNNVIIVDFNSSESVNKTFEFNTKFSINEIEVGVFSIKIRIYAIIDSNVTISSSAYLTQTYITEITETLNTLYLIIPIVAVIGIVMFFAKNKDE